MVYLPVGIGHGFVAHQDNTVATYLTSTAYDPSREFGVRITDPALGIDCRRFSTPTSPQISTLPQSTRFFQRRTASLLFSPTLTTGFPPGRTVNISRTNYATGGRWQTAKPASTRSKRRLIADGTCATNLAGTSPVDPAPG